MITEETKVSIIFSMEVNLDTRDKRFMFLKCSFPDFIPYIILEGNPHETAWNIYSHFDKNQMLGSLTAHLNSVFGSEITFETK
jgi:hypothetical protein